MKYFEPLKSLPHPPQTSDDEIRRFSDRLEAEVRNRDAWLVTLGYPERLDRMDILRWIIEARESGDMEEALWRGFLAAHFGRPSVEHPSQIESAGRLLCGFGTTPVWTWRRVSENLPAFESWLLQHAAELASLSFGNHRKYEAKKASILFAVVSSFVDWVRRFGVTPRAAFAVDGADTPESRFDTLIHRLRSIHRFGRLACFDMLCLFGDAGLLPVRPGSCYLEGATGPLRAAIRLWGPQTSEVLTGFADEAARHLRVPIEAFEDALCNWQKSPRARTAGKALIKFYD